jgi:hypothetical protein
VRLSEVFTDAPVARDELRHDPQFAQAAILQQPFAGNPFLLTDGEWRAILNRHRGGGPGDGPEPDANWSLSPGATIRRSELHDRYGGSRQDGISSSRKTPNILIFTDPRSGERHGYYDRWATDDSFHYTGRGQRGDQTLTSGNLAIANHAKDGRALRLFQGAKGIVQYIGEFVLDDQDPYDWGTAHSTGGGPQRRVIRFHLRRVDRPPPRPETGPLGMPFQPRDETIRPTSPTTRTPQDPDAAGRGGVPTTNCRTNSPNSSARLGGRRGIRRQSTRSSTWHGKPPRASWLSRSRAAPRKMRSASSVWASAKSSTTTTACVPAGERSYRCCTWNGNHRMPLGGTSDAPPRAADLARHRARAVPRALTGSRDCG